MIYKKFLGIILSVFIFNSCYVVKAKKVFRGEMETCFTGKHIANISELINTDGFFSEEKFSEGANRYLHSNMFFFSDGIFTSGVSIKGQYSPDYIQHFFNNENFDDENWNAFYWGVYDLQGDTIKTKSIFIGTLNAGWSMREEWFQVIDNLTLRSIYAKPIGKDYLSQEVLEKYWFNRDNHTTAIFFQLKTIPSSDCWLKREKWFWCNEDEWRAFMVKNGYKIRRRDREK